MKTACRRAQAAHPNFGTICDRDQNSTNKIHTDQDLVTYIYQYFNPRCKLQRLSKYI